MKRKILGKITTLLFATIFLAGSIQVLPVKAGASDIVIDKDSFATELNSAVWNDRDGDVEVERGVLIFTEESTDTTSLVTKTNAKVSEKHDELITVDVTMQLTKLPEKGKFVLALGLPSIESALGDDGNIEIAFENNGRLQVDVVAYEDGEEVVLSEPKACGSIGSNIKVKAVISNKGVLTLMVNGKEACQKELPFSGEGRVGFLQTGSCAAKISDLRIVSHKYDTPENTNIFEDFEDGYMNTNVLTHNVFIRNAKYAPSRCFVDEVDGNKVFRFQNAGDFYFGTLYEYSNFQLTFDVIDMQREDILDEVGNIITPRNPHVCVAYGSEAADYMDYGYVQSTDLLIFDSPSRLVSYNTDKIEDLASKGYDYTSEKCEKDFSIQVTMIDSWVTVGFKWVGEEQFTEVMKYQPSTETPTGYVQIWSSGGAANFAIDNFQIINLDKDAQIIEVENGTYEIEKPADFDYQPLKHTYRLQEEGAFSVYYIVAMVAVVCAVALGVTLAIKKARRKENDEHEQ